MYRFIGIQLNMNNNGSEILQTFKTECHIRYYVHPPELDKLYIVQKTETFIKALYCMHTAQEYLDSSGAVI